MKHLFILLLLFAFGCSRIAHRVAYGPKKTIATTTPTTIPKPTYSTAGKTTPGIDRAEYERLVAEVETLKKSQHQIIADNKQLQKLLDGQSAKSRRRSANDPLYGESSTRKQSKSEPSSPDNTRHYYVVEDSIEVYEGLYSSRRLNSLMPGDTISSDNPLQTQTVTGRQSVEWRGYMVAISRPSARLVGVRKNARRTIMYPMVSPFPSYGVRSSSSDKPPSTMYSTPTTGATINTGPRGGRYYINSNGNKTYIKRK